MTKELEELERKLDYHTAKLDLEIKIKGYQKKSSILKRYGLIIGTTVLLAGAAVGGYFGYSYSNDQNIKSESVLEQQVDERDQQLESLLKELKKNLTIVHGLNGKITGLTESYQKSKEAFEKDLDDKNKSLLAQEKTIEKKEELLFEKDQLLFEQEKELESSATFVLDKIIAEEIAKNGPIKTKLSEEELLKKEENIKKAKEIALQGKKELSTVFWDKCQSKLRSEILDKDYSVSLNPKCSYAIDVNSSYYNGVKDDLKKVIYQFDQALELDLKSVDALIGKGDAHFLIREFSESIKQFDTALELTKEKELIYLRRGLTHYMISNDKTLHLKSSTEHLTQANLDLEKAIETFDQSYSDPGCSLEQRKLIVSNYALVNEYLALIKEKLGEKEIAEKYKKDGLYWKNKSKEIMKIFKNTTPEIVTACGNVVKDPPALNDCIKEAKSVEIVNACSNIGESSPIVNECIKKAKNVTIVNSCYVATDSEADWLKCVDINTELDIMELCSEVIKDKKYFIDCIKGGGGRSKYMGYDCNCNKGIQFHNVCDEVIDMKRRDPKYAENVAAALNCDKKDSWCTKFINYHDECITSIRACAEIFTSDENIISCIGTEISPEQAFCCKSIYDSDNAVLSCLTADGYTGKINTCLKKYHNDLKNQEKEE